VLETPTISQRAAFAQVHTAGSSVSVISSLGHSQPLACSASTISSRRLTRSSSCLEDHDSDDDVTDNESEYELDIHQNFWESRRRIIRDMVLDGTFEDEEMDDEGDVTTVPENVVLNDFSRLLKDCKEFTFTELTEEQTRIIPKPQKIYEGPSGLRRNVATSFKMPLGAFRKAGFMLDLVKRWVENSNQ
jgi:hypothetical protein